MTCTVPVTALLANSSVDYQEKCFDFILRHSITDRGQFLLFQLQYLIVPSIEGDGAL